ncbi:MAG: hypothetical protein PHO03_01720 [Candidatus Omnitrophica bacterium]|jgi:hypothetical protein|nr:hypothetical protein [Candidatus Omnitrophota bacterium]MDD5053425.1 hypothetical protein [Sulfuricurvum sp.]
MLDNRKVIIDEECCLNDNSGSEAIVASSAGSVDGVAKVFDTGGGYTSGMIFCDVSTKTKHTTAVSNSTIAIVLQGSTTSTFTASFKLAEVVKFGNVSGTQNADTTGSSSATQDGTGLYRTPFHNDFAGTILRYLRAYVICAGTINETDVRFKMWLSKQ